jgi:hypothetical protein
MFDKLRKNGTSVDILRYMETLGVVDIDELDSSLNQIAGHLNAQHALLVDLTTELLAHEDWWRGPGIHSPEPYLAWRTCIRRPQRAETRGPPSLITISWDRTEEELWLVGNW